MRVRLVAIGMALAVTAAGCGDGTDADQTAAAESAVVAAETTTSQPEATSSSAPAAREMAPGIDELAFLLDDLAASGLSGSGSTTAVTSADTASDASDSESDTDVDETDEPATSPPTTAGTGGPPVTTVPPPVPTDPSAIYRGELGTLGADEVVAAPVATPPPAQEGVQPLTGLAGDVPSRPAAIVKIDNGSRARPQSGIDVADIVVEEEVEGGITRFAAVFHSTNAIVGPVRSGRTTDIGVLMGFGSPLLMYSGANEVTDALLLDRSNVQNRSAGRSSGYWRNRSRRAPSNLYTDTAPHWASASGGPPPPQFAYRAPGTPADGDPASSFTVAFRANTAAWDWDGTAWLRSQGGRPHTAASGARISAANVVVIETRKIDTGMVDASGATVPEFVFVGSGRATVFTDGKKIVGTWTRPSLASVATLTRADGSVIELTPGRTWIELIQAGAGILR